MRLLGPGSVSSFLKIVLDVIYVILWVALAVTVLGAVMLLILNPFTANVLRLNLGDLRPIEAQSVVGKTPALAGLVLIVAAYIGVLLVVFNRIRRVFETLTVGDPFRPQNVGRLRVVGLALIVLEALSYGIHLLAGLILSDRAHSLGISVNLTGWFAILVVFVLAEVFGEGARLRQDAELTI